MSLISTLMTYNCKNNLRTNEYLPSKYHVLHFDKLSTPSIVPKTKIRSSALTPLSIIKNC